MKRNLVKVARSRIEDIEVGDVVNRDPDADTGWFEVDVISVLFNGNVQLSDRSELITISGPFFTMVGVQFVSTADVPAQPDSPLPPKDSLEPTEPPSSDDEAETKPSEMPTPAALAG